jgi:tRNA threonylcarbamoyladenosine biosynthesis protein TsaB
VRILAIDTATESCSAALLIDGRVLARERLLERGHAEHILAMVDELLGEGAIALRDLSAIAFGRGPGAFTGVRLAASVTQGLAYGAGVPVVPVSDLRALAERVLTDDAALDHVLVCADARMCEVYWAWFERGRDGHAIGRGEERVSRPADVVLLVSSAQAIAGMARFAAAGSGFAAYPQLRTAIGAQALRILEGLRPHAREVATLAAEEVAAGRVLPADQALPRYLRDDVTRPAHDQSLN